MAPMVKKKMPSSSSLRVKHDPIELYESFVNPQWVRLLDILQMNVSYVRCVGCELQTSDGRRILDFNSGYCVYNSGHNHPRIRAALRAQLDSQGPAMLQSSVSDLAGELAARLCERAGGRLTKAFFCSSGSEGVETVIKFVRAHTGRTRLLSARSSFHGLTCGALSLMSDGFWKDGFGPMLPDIEQVTFGDIEELSAKLSSRLFASIYSRTDPGRRRSPNSHPRIHAKGAGTLQAPWHPVRAGRGPDRPLPNRSVSRLPSFRR